MTTGQQHPNNLCLKICGVLFLPSALSYLVDYFHFQGEPALGGLILTFMLLKAGLVVEAFIPTVWERLALVYAILLPLLCLVVLVVLMAAEADHTFVTRLLFFRWRPGF